MQGFPSTAVAPPHGRFFNSLAEALSTFHATFMRTGCSNFSGEAFHKFLGEENPLPETTVGNARLVDA
ncbi:hypothetical protein [Nostoc sp. ChiSLP03a]|uniref:hypothetical protein n=1 Tax=Nostoc sp. ChiSLP03a TaxID=3075380 RepID=UPI002AD34964|nr:hypothetical protein [Nostoc sp. ChiSLP03a]MDZ8214133.1 hypothetical protein [Nostoc sp. ChiSLP03a]